MDMTGEELTNFTLIWVGEYEESSPVSTEEMDFNLSERWSDQSEIKLIYHQTPSWTELYFQALYRVDVVIV